MSDGCEIARGFKVVDHFEGVGERRQQHMRFPKQQTYSFLHWLKEKRS